MDLNQFLRGHNLLELKAEKILGLGKLLKS